MPSLHRIWNLIYDRQKYILKNKKWIGTGRTWPDTEAPDRARATQISAGSWKVKYSKLYWPEQPHERQWKITLCLTKGSWLRNHNKPKTVDLVNADDSKRVTGVNFTMIRQIDTDCDSDRRQHDSNVDDDPEIWFRKPNVSGLTGAPDDVK